VAQEVDQPPDNIPAGMMAEDASEEEEAEAEAEEEKEEEESIDPELLFKATVPETAPSPQAIYQRYSSLNPDYLQFITDQYDTINETE
jgi:hypothetical protein